MRERGGIPASLGRVVPLAAGLAILVLGTAFGWNAALVEAVVTPPSVVRAALVAAALIAGFLLLARALERLTWSGGPDAPARDIAGMLRGIRLVFLAVAAFSAAAGWLLGHPLPLVLALVIAGIDIVETSFLLLVVAASGSKAEAGIGPREP